LDNINETFEYISKIENENLLLKLDQAEQQKLKSIINTAVNVEMTA
jgi:hypothetical protein